MKKLIVMALTALAVSAQGATVAWNSGPLRNPIDMTGATGATPSMGVGNMRIWFFASLANANTFRSGIQNLIFEDSGVLGRSPGLLHTGSTIEGTVGTTRDNSAGAGGIYTGTTGAWFAPATPYFTVAYVETALTGHANPNMNIRWFMWSPVATFTTPGVGQTVINFTTGGGALPAGRVWPTRWTPIPEPSTGLLAVAGLGLLLRRRSRSVA